MNLRHLLLPILGSLSASLLLFASPGHADAPAGRYTLTADSVYDTQTKLTWQRTIPSGSYTWAEAKTYCAGLSLSGGGWRLPSMKELQTIVDRTKQNPAIDSTAFPSTPSDLFLSSSPNAELSSEAWYVDFSYGYSGHDFVEYPLRVRCVR